MLHQLLRLVTLLALTMRICPSAAQPEIEASVATRVREDTLLVDFYVLQTQGQQLELGSSNFALRPVVGQRSLRLTSASLRGGFSRWSAAPGYFPLALGGMDRGFINVSVKARTRADSGKGVPNDRTRVAQVRVPIVDACDTVQFEWLRDPVAVTDFNGKDIKNTVTWVPPSPVELSEEPSQPMAYATGDTLHSWTRCRGCYWVLDSRVVDSGQSVVMTDPGRYWLARFGRCDTAASDTFRYRTTRMKRKTLRMPTVRVVPNPFLDRTSIYVTPMARGRLQVEVYNSSGDKIARLLDRHTQGGETRVIWRTSGLPPGPYLVTVKVGSSTVVRKVVKQR